MSYNSFLRAHQTHEQELEKAANFPIHFFFLPFFFFCANSTLISIFNRDCSEPAANSHDARNWEKIVLPVGEKRFINCDILWLLTAEFLTHEWTSDSRAGTSQVAATYCSDTFHTQPHNKTDYSDYHKQHEKRSFTLGTKEFPRSRFCFDFRPSKAIWLHLQYPVMC